MGDNNLLLFIQENVHGTPNWIGFEVTNVLLWLNPRKISMYPGEKNTVKDARLVYQKASSVSDISSANNCTLNERASLTHLAPSRFFSFSFLNRLITFQFKGSSRYTTRLLMYRSIMLRRISFEHVPSNAADQHPVVVEFFPLSFDVLPLPK